MGLQFWPSGGPIGAVIFAIVLVTAWVVFALRIRTLLRLMLAGRPENRFDHVGDRIKYFTLMVLGQRGVLRDPLPGLAHFFTFWGFIIIQLDALNLWAMGLGFKLPIISSRPFAIVLDFFIVMAFIAMIFFTFRRVVLRPRSLRSQSHGMADAFVILGLITLVLVTLVAFEIFAFVATHGEEWTPIGSWLGSMMLGLPDYSAAAIASVAWWGNALTVLGFLMYLPYSKHLHLLATPFNVFFRNYGPRGALQPIQDLEEREDYGVHEVTQFTWKQLLDGYACTECGRCNSVCPALATDKPLWPKEIILGVKEEIFASANMVLVGAGETEEAAKHEPMVGGLIKDE